MEERKLIEKKYHNLKRDSIAETAEHSDYVSSQRKWYSITEASNDCIDKWLSKNVLDKKTLDYGCGNGKSSIKMAQLGAKEVWGIDISDVSIQNALKETKNEGLFEKIKYQVMDAEQTSFKNESFDIIYESGTLHHLDLKKAYFELSRILKKDGKMLCHEALGHNFLIHRYRKRTPHLRTRWEAEHILRKKDILMASRFFDKVEVLGFFHLTAIAAVPFNNSFIFNPVLKMLNFLDGIFLNLPVIKWQAWQIVFILSEPRK